MTYSDIRAFLSEKNHPDTGGLGLSAMSELKLTDKLLKHGGLTGKLFGSSSGFFSSCRSGLNDRRNLLKAMSYTINSISRFSGGIGDLVVYLGNSAGGVSNKSHSDSGFLNLSESRCNQTSDIYSKTYACSGCNCTDNAQYHHGKLSVFMASV